MAKQLIEPKTTYTNVPTLDKMPSADEKRTETTIEQPPATNPASRQTEIGGPKGLEPTRYGDWEKNGRCIDF